MLPTTGLQILDASIQVAQIRLTDIGIFPFDPIDESFIPYAVSESVRRLDETFTTRAVSESDEQLDPVRKTRNDFHGPFRSDHRPYKNPEAAVCNVRQTYVRESGANDGNNVKYGNDGAEPWARVSL